MPDAQRHAASHFQDLATQHRASELGMWVFLASEALLFGGLFGLYTAFAVVHPEAFHRAAGHNNMLLGTAMTALLLVSSFFVAWAVHASEHGARRQALWSLSLVVLLGAAFLGLKAHEYAQHIHHGILPGRYFASGQLTSEGARLFFTLYYALTGLHALHVVAGLVLLGVFMLMLLRPPAEASHHGLKLAGLYWHLVDIIWIFLWPLLYLP